MSVSICAPVAYRARVVERCPYCRRKRRVVASFFEWYSPYSTCCACGDQWGEGAPRRTRSKKKLANQAARARAQWRVAATQDETIRVLMDAMTKSEAPSGAGGEGT